MKVALLGDIGLFGKFDISSGICYEDYFADVIPLLQSMDLVVGNLETPFQDGFRVAGAKSAYIGTSRESVEVLELLNVSCVNLANNHTGDYGVDGYNLTKKLLSENGIDFFGIEDKQYYLNSQDSKIAFSGFCNFDTNPCFTNFGGQQGVNIVDYDHIIALLKKNHDEGWLNIMSFHSGLEHVNYPSVQDVKFARSISGLFPYVYYGHHPHVVQGVECLNEALVFYSLGNFCFDDIYLRGRSEPFVTMSDNNRTGMIAVVNIENNKITSYECIPIYIGQDKMLVGEEYVNNFPLLEYSSGVKNADSIDYVKFRSRLLDEYSKSRKQLRNMSWYIKRLRPKYFRLLLSAKRNSMLYRKHYSEHLDSI